MDDMTNEERKKLIMETKKISTRIKFNERVCLALSSRIEIIEKQNDVLQGEKQKLFDEYKTYRAFLKKQMRSSNKTTAKSAKKEYAHLEKLKKSAVNTFDKVVARYEPHFDKYKGYKEFREGPIPSSLRMLSEAKETKNRTNKHKTTSIIGVDVEMDEAADGSNNKNDDKANIKTSTKSVKETKPKNVDGDKKSAEEDSAEESAGEESAGEESAGRESAEEEEEEESAKEESAKEESAEEEEEEH